MEADEYALTIVANNDLRNRGIKKRATVQVLGGWEMKPGRRDARKFSLTKPE